MSNSKLSYIIETCNIDHFILANLFGVTTTELLNGAVADSVAELYDDVLDAEDLGLQGVFIIDRIIRLREHEE